MATQAHSSGLSSMFDAVEMMRKTWSGMNVPSSLQPTMDVAEIDRRIADLRVVEQWLQLNQTMLQTTIQTLEIQRNTVAAFQAFSKAGAMVASPPVVSPAASPASSPATGPATGPAASPSATPTPEAGPAAVSPQGSSIAAAQAALWWDFLQQPFRQMTEAANRHIGADSATESRHPLGGQPPPPARDPSGGQQAPASDSPSNPANSTQASIFDRSGATESPSIQRTDRPEAPNHGRTNSTRGTRR